MSEGRTSRGRIGSVALVLPASLVIVLAIGGPIIDGGAPVEPGAAVSLAAVAVIVVLTMASAGVRRAIQVVTIVAAGGLVLDAGWRPVDVVAVLVGLAVVAVVADRIAAELDVLREQHARERQQLERRVAMLTAVEALPDTHDEAIAEVVATVRSLAFDMAGVSFVRDGKLVGELLDGVVDLPPLPPGRGLAWRSILEDRTITTRDYTAEPDRLDERTGVGPVVVVPIRVDGRPVGALMGARYADTRLTEVEIEVAEVLAAHLGSVLTALDRERRQAELLTRAARLDELRSSLIAAVSEEVRTPIAAVAGASEQLRSPAAVAGEPDATTAAALAHLRASAAELHTTVTTVLAVARRRLTRDAGDLEVVTLGELIAGITGAVVTSEPPGWDQRVRVVPGLVAHAVELLTGGTPATPLVHVHRATSDDDPVVTVRSQRTASPSPVVRSLAAQLLVAAGAELVGAEGVAIRLQRAPVGEVG